jgi:hypothetical protein
VPTPSPANEAPALAAQSQAAGPAAVEAPKWANGGYARNG